MEARNAPILDPNLKSQLFAFLTWKIRIHFALIRRFPPSSISGFTDHNLSILRMQKNDHYAFLPLSICRRLFDFIINSLFRRASAAHPSSSDVDVDSLPRNCQQNYLKFAASGGEQKVLRPDWDPPKNYSEPEISLEFEHGLGSEQWSSPRDLGSPGDLFPATGECRADKSSAETSQNGVPKKEKEKSKMKEKLSEGLVGDVQKRPLRRTLLPNINEESDAFIRKKREDLRRAFCMEDDAEMEVG
ncbi:hypothetical protein NMG60_11034891 [Bertholletia excelsa]